MDEKYLPAIVTSYLFLVAYGLRFLGIKTWLVTAAAGTLILVAMGWSLFNHYFEPEYAKSPGWRSPVQGIEARA